MGKRYKRKDRKVVVLYMLRTLFIITLFISIFYIVRWYIDTKQNKFIEEKI